MADELARRFTEALQHLEQSGDLERMVGLFAEDARISNAASSKTFEGEVGAREFWRMYLSNFREIRSDFKRVIATGEGASLEWTSRGVRADGEPFEYSGVTLLDFSDGEVTRFHSYFDPASIGTQLSGREREDSGGIPASAVTDTSYASPGRTP